MSEPVSPGGLSADKQALLAVRRLKSRVDELERARREPLAIVGAGCRLPGGVSSPDEFWTLLKEGVDAVSEVPPDRWDIDAFYDPDPDAAGKMYTRRAGFLSSIDTFDARFFGITPREAITMDPQQRLLLEVAWEALERAGIAPDRLAGSDTGVYVGISTNDYGQILLRASDQIEPGMYFGTGNLLNASAGRLSYVLGLQGPSMAVDTACSSSLVAIHLACQALRNRECRVALAGGVNLVLVPEVSVNCCRARMLAPDGRCKTFDAAADGYVRAEGCAMIVLKRLSDAIADGDRMLAVIRGSAVNQDGRSGGFTAPNELAQQAVIRAALANGGVHASEIAYVEAHGTGTALGDPIEMHAIVAALREGGASKVPLVVGSVKTNVGHLESAAGVTGLLKVALALQHGEIPPHRNFARLNPHIDLGGAAVEIPCAARAWAPRDPPRLGAVSSFGFTGTNAHAVLEEAPPLPARAAVTDRLVHVIPLSARTPAALADLARRYADTLRPETPLGDVGATAAQGRASFEHRLAVVAATSSEAREQLLSAASGSGTRVRAGKARSRDEGAVFLFTGQGSQYAGMGAELYAGQPVFRAALDRCAGLLDGLLERPLLSVLFPTDGAASPIDETAFTQPALFALEYALSELWRSWGVLPSAVMGHSIGEYVAACVAGAFTLEDAITLVAARGRLMQALPQEGAMAALMADERRVRGAIAPYTAHVSIAALNGSSNTVIAGERSAISAIVDALGREGISGRLLPVSHAFHSPLMEPMLGEFERIASSITYAPLQLPLASNVTGRLLEPGFVFDAPYWRRHAREAVRFADGVDALHAAGGRVFLEVGPSATLTAMAQRALVTDQVSWLASLRKGQSDWRQLLDAVAGLFVAGVRLDWAAFDAPYARRRVELPTYPFQRERFWVKTTPPKAAADAASAPGFYALGWERVEGSVPPPARSTPSRLAIVASDSVLVRATAAEFERSGTTCQTLPPGHAVDAIASSVDAFVLFASAADAGSADGRRRAMEDCAVLAALLRAASGCRPAPRVFVVTTDAQAPTAADVPQPTGAVLWGFARTAAIEHPDVWGGIIDVSGSAGAHDALSIAALVRSDSREQFAVRGGERYAARLAPVTDMPAGTLHLDGSGTYLVTGGLGSLGLAVAARLAERGARYMALVSRRTYARGSDASIDGGLAAIERAGAVAQLFSADVAERSEVRSLFARLESCAPPVRGIVHAAGVASAADAVDVTLPQLEEALRAKVEGGWNLHEATRALGLDFFVAFSSISAVWGSKALAAYAAANHYLDALAWYRRALGLPALSIDWGPWSGGGMTGGDAQRWLSSMGMEALAPTRALDAFESAILSGRAQIVAAAVDWERFLPVYEARGRHPFMDRLRRRDPAAVSSASDTSFVDGLAALVPLERRRAILRVVRDHVAAVISVDSSVSIAEDDGLFEMGMDSLMATALKSRLERQFARPLSPTLTFDYSTIAALAAHLDAECFAAEPAPAPVAPPPPPSGGGLADAIAALESLSDEQIDAMISGVRR